MRLARRRRGHALSVDMTPMIDVTFLLIIFFITVNQVSNVNKEPIALPELTGTQDQTEAALTVNIDRTGRLVVAGNEVTVPQLVSLVAAELAKVDNDPGRLTVVLRADRDGTSRGVNEVVAALVKLNVTRVRIAVESAP
jgi:biopolymer transport protein ExbD